MAMFTLTEGRHTGGFIVSEAESGRSRSVLTLKQGNVVQAGQVLGLLAGTAPDEIAVQVVPSGSNVGAGLLIMASPATGAGVKAGTYLTTCIAEAANGGTFQVTGPDGAVLAPATVGTPYDEAVKFTIVHDGEDFDVGDAFAISVTITSDALGDDCGAFDQHASDGREVARCIAYDNCDASERDTSIVVMARSCQVAGFDLVWPNDIEAGELATAIRQLAAPGVGIIVR